MALTISPIPEKAIRAPKMHLRDSPRMHRPSRLQTVEMMRHQDQQKWRRDDTKVTRSQMKTCNNYNTIIAFTRLRCTSDYVEHYHVLGPSSYSRRVLNVAGLFCFHRACKGKLSTVSCFVRTIPVVGMYSDIDSCESSSIDVYSMRELRQHLLS